MVKTLKLNQIIAITNGKKSKAESVLTGSYHVLQKVDLFEGFVRNYVPDDEEGETLPKEEKKVQEKVSDILEKCKKVLEEEFEMVCAQDLGNCHAKANIVLDGKVLAENVPATHLIFLEKMMTEHLRTLASKLPVLDPSQDWKEDNTTNLQKSGVEEQRKMKKVMKSHELAPATKEHPAQVTSYTEDVKIGMWNKVRFSGAIDQKEKDAMLERISRVRDAIKIAREEANSIEVDVVNCAEGLLNYIFEG